MRPWLAGLLLGCAGGAVEDSAGQHACDAPLRIELGTGETAYAPLVEGQEVVMVHGPQGGWHVDVAARVHHVGQYVAVTPALHLVAHQEQIAGDQQAEYLELPDWTEEGCAGTFWGKRAFLDDHPGTDQRFICSLAGERAILSVVVVDLEDQRQARASGEVTLALDPNDEPWCR